MPLPNHKKICVITKGRSTNCKINNAILVEARREKFFDIFVFETEEHKNVKKEMLEDFSKTYYRQPKYNERI